MFFICSPSEGIFIFFDCVQKLLFSCLQRVPVVGIITRHDFMPEHVLSLHPSLAKSKWKRLRFKLPPLVKLFQRLHQTSKTVLLRYVNRAVQHGCKMLSAIIFVPQFPCQIKDPKGLLQTDSVFMQLLSINSVMNKCFHFCHALFPFDSALQTEQ